MYGQFYSSPESQYIVSGSHAGKINLYNAKSRQKEKHELDREVFEKLLKTLEGHAMIIHSLDLSLDSQRSPTGSDNGRSK